MRVLLTTEGTYPYSAGGVSTWAHSLVSGMAQHDFTVVSVVANPHVQARYRPPDNVSVVAVPMWGAERVEEYLPAPRRASRARRRAARREFLPVLTELCDQLLVATAAPDIVASCLTSLAELCLHADLRTALRDENVWHAVLDRMAAHPLFRHAPLGGAIDLARSLYRYLTPLALPVAPTDVIHSSAAAFCALPALAAKLRHGAPLLLTEHGVYLRERVLQLIRDKTPSLRKMLFANLYRGVVQAAYWHADVIAPVCSYNTRWERQLTADLSRSEVIYNGIDPEAFPVEPPRTDRPTVAYVGRIDPLKDVLNLISAARLVRAEVSDVVFRLYGSDSDADYARRCRETAQSMGLADTVRFEGGTDDVAGAYRDSDVVVLPSVSEGFPYTAIEAMMSARPLVGTAVGGVPEAVDDPGLLVPPRNPAALADKLVTLLCRSPRERGALGERLRSRAVAHFSRQSFLEGYDALYRQLGTSGA
jgi:glycosyltransferase involved in cell wall biosynthesis